MNRVTKRTWLMGLFIFILLGGLVLFLWDYARNGDDWVSFTGSPHLYNNTNIGAGTVTDRSATMLLDIGEKRTYASDTTTRKSTLHWLGDRKGFISASAVSHYAAEMSGFDLVNGIYDTSGTGGTATLTLSARVQNAALNAMAGRKGTIGVYNYKTGEILCAVTTPTYDPDNVPDIGENPGGEYEGIYLNRFLQSTYIPGSIFKVVTTSAALECVPDILDKTFTCYGKVEYGEESVTCETAHGKVTLKTALAKSCNCAFAQIAELVGKQNMVKYVERFQVTEPLAFDGVTTARGNYDVSKTAPVSFAWSCIGQYTDQINPARYMTLMGAIAGGGQAAEPYIVSKVSVGEDVTYEAKTTKTDRLMSGETAETVKSFMRNNVQSVYGDWNFPGLNVCAKSGTSQLGGGQTSNAMFAGFVADESYPLAFIVVVENGGYGASTCVPILSKVLTECKAVMDGE
ncbi:MAG: penicillin-binding protein [Oscillospiraceae bacterium]|nr:penicillin-binding protein [Oscillospiraceae bacterium]